MIFFFLKTEEEIHFLSTVINEPYELNITRVCVYIYILLTRAYKYINIYIYIFVYVLKDIGTSIDDEVITVCIVLNIFCGSFAFNSWSLHIKHTKRSYATLIRRLLLFYSRTSTRQLSSFCFPEA